MMCHAAVGNPWVTLSSPPLLSSPAHRLKYVLRLWQQTKFHFGGQHSEHTQRLYLSLPLSPALSLPPLSKPITVGRLERTHFITRHTWGRAERNHNQHPAVSTAPSTSTFLPPLFISALSGRHAVLTLFKHRQKQNLPLKPNILKSNTHQCWTATHFTKVTHTHK